MLWCVIDLTTLSRLLWTSESLAIGSISGNWVCHFLATEKIIFFLLIYICDLCGVQTCVKNSLNCAVTTPDNRIALFTFVTELSLWLCYLNTRFVSMVTLCQTFSSTVVFQLRCLCVYFSNLSRVVNCLFPLTQFLVSFFNGKLPAKGMITLMVRIALIDADYTLFLYTLYTFWLLP